MPIFDFECLSCEHVFEGLVKDTDEYPECENCKSLKTLRLVSAPKIGGVAAQKIKDRAIQGGASVTPPVRVTVPSNYKKKNDRTSRTRKT